MRNRIVVPTFFILAFLLKGGVLSFAGEHTVDPREMGIDRAVGGMEEGSRILSPESGAGRGQVQQIPGKGLGPSTDTRAVSSGAGAPTAPPSQPPLSTQPTQPMESGSSTTVTPPSQVAPPAPTIEQPTYTTPSPAQVEPPGQPAETPHVETPVEQPPLEHPIVEEPIAQQPIIETPPIGETPIVETPPIESPIEETIAEPVGGGTDRSIIEVGVDANLSPDEISVDAGVSVEPEAGGGLLNAETTTTATTDTVNQELTTETGLQVDVGKDTTIAELTLGTETGTTDTPPSGEVEAGVEADVEGTGAGDDVTSNAADGLL